MAVLLQSGSLVEPILPVSLTRMLAAALPHAPEGLIDAAARATLAAITDRVPAALTRRTYLECRLADGAPRVDVVFCVDRSNCTLLMEPRSAWLPAHLQGHPLWRGLGRVAAHWTDPASPIGAGIYDLWLEFDATAPPPAGDLLVPGVFIGLARSVATPPLDTLEAGLAALEVLLSRALGPGPTTAARRVVAALPPGASVPYVGVMYPRSDTAIRLCLSPLAGTVLLDYLQAIAWPGEIEHLARCLRAIPRGSGRNALDAAALLHVDVEAGVQPRIGIEVPLPQYPRPLDTLDERVLFDALRAQGLCASAKHEALVRWPGFSVEQFPHQCWPSTAVRRVSHVKLVYEPGRGLEAKTYLSFFQHVIDRRGRRTATAAEGGGSHEL